MDSRVRGRSISDYVVKIFYLIPVLTYAVTEIIICCLWNLLLRLAYSLCSLALDRVYSNFENGTMTRQVPFKDKNSRHKAPTCKETTSSPEVKQANKTGFYRSTKSPETFTSFEKTIESKGRLQTKTESRNQQNPITLKNTKKRTLQLIIKQWAIQEIIWKADRDLKEEGALLHKNSAAKCQTDTGGKHEKEELISGEEISTLELEDLGVEESERRPRQEKALECSLRVDKETSQSKKEEGSCRPKVCPFSYLNASSCEGAKENAHGLKEANTCILASDRSAVSEEQCCSSVLVKAHAPTDTLHYSGLTPLEAGGAQTNSLSEHLEAVGVAPACVATKPDCANTTRVADGDTCQTELLLEDLFRDKYNKDAEVSRSDPHQPQDTFEVRNAKIEQPGKFNAPHYPEVENESQKIQKCVNAKKFWSKHRLNHGKLSRFRFTSLRSVLRNKKMPHM